MIRWAALISYAVLLASGALTLTGYLWLNAPIKQKQISHAYTRFASARCSAVTLCHASRGIRW